MRETLYLRLVGTLWILSGVRDLYSPGFFSTRYPVASIVAGVVLVMCAAYQSRRVRA